MPKNSNTDPKPQCVQTDVMQSALLSKIKIDIRNKIGKGFKYFDFYFKEKCFCYKKKYEAEGKGSMMYEWAFDEINFNDSIEQVCFRLKFDVKELDIYYAEVEKGKKHKLIQQRRITASIKRKVRRAVA